MYQLWTYLEHVIVPNSLLPFFFLNKVGILEWKLIWKWKVITNVKVLACDQILSVEFDSLNLFFLNLCLSS